jgi:hypothetical protein
VSGKKSEEEGVKTEKKYFHGWKITAMISAAYTI